jgi:hypothetical protein
MLGSYGKDIKYLGNTESTRIPQVLMAEKSKVEFVSE